MTHIEQRGDTAAGWTAANPVLNEYEVGYESDSLKTKHGDGFTPWNGLPYDMAEVAFDPADWDLDLVDNTPDLDKPITTAMAAALDEKAPLASPVFTGNPTAPTPTPDDNDTSIATTAFVRQIMLAMHPIGRILFSADNVNPGTYLGGTWAAWGSGRVPVGVDVAQTEFDTAEETGGAKTHTLTTAEMPAHTHPGTPKTDSTNLTWQTNKLGTGTGGVWSNGAGGANIYSVASQGGGAAHNNLQPYITCYMWKRTA